VWKVGDIGVGAMAWINIVTILILSPKALRTLRDYEQQKKQGLEPVFNPDKLGIKDVEYWHEDQMNA
jgi:AGCS family alanine or glycine:cation symporter